MKRKLTRKIIHFAQESWANGILRISNAHRNKEDYKTLAANFIRQHYGYDDGMVLFKPTLATREQFRETFEKALSYFVSGNPSFPEDRGFAIQPWERITFNNAGIMFLDGRAVAMGNYFFTDIMGNQIKVEYTFGYFLNRNDEIKIYLHHSSIPYTNGEK